MKVKELIKKLQEYNQDAEVMINQVVTWCDETNEECSPILLENGELETARPSTNHRRVNPFDYEDYNPTPDDEAKATCTHVLIRGENL